VTAPATRDEHISVLRAAEEEPDRVALVADGRALSYADLAARAFAAIAWLAERGIDAARPGRVAITARSDPATFALLHALVEIGAPAVLVHPRSTHEERDFVARDAQADLVVDAAPDLGGLAPPRAVPIPADARPMALVYTSGTSGRPKGAVLSRAAFAAAARASASNLGWRDDDRWLLCMPLAHVGGFSILVRCLLARAAVVTTSHARFDPEAIATVLARDRVTLVSFVPTMLVRLLDAGATIPDTVRAVLLGGAAADDRLLDRARALRVPVLTTYGLTEACAQVTTQRYGTEPGAEHGVGEPLPGVEVRIVDGEVHVRGPSLMTGYFPIGAHPSPFTDDGWLPTGDLGRLDDRGRLWIDARRTDLIVTGGENVYPAEVERVLEGIPGVAAACVFGVPDATWGATVAAAVVWSEPSRTVDAVAEAVVAKLAPYKRPRWLADVSTLAFTTSGKLDRERTKQIAFPRLRPLLQHAASS